jgi:hypothetical protein
MHSVFFSSFKSQKRLLLLSRSCGAPPISSTVSVVSVVVCPFCVDVVVTLVIFFPSRMTVVVLVEIIGTFALAPEGILPAILAPPIPLEKNGSLAKGSLDVEWKEVVAGVREKNGSLSNALTPRGEVFVADALVKEGVLNGSRVKK